MFKIHKDAKRWGENLLNKNGPIKTQFDLYYLSFIIGVGLGRSPNFDQKSVGDITRTVTEPYIPYRYVLAGLLLVTELKNSGLIIDKDVVKTKVSNLLNSNSPTYLSDDALELMNGYAYGGFEAMREKLPKAPPTHEFLIWYHAEMIPDSFESGVW